MVESRRIMLNLGVGKLLATSQGAAEQDGSIDGRNFRLAETGPSRVVHEVVEQTVLGGSLMRQEMQGLLHPAFDFGARTVAAFMTNTERRQAKASCSNTGLGPGSTTVRIGAVPHQPAHRIGFPANFPRGLLGKKKVL